MRRAHILLAPIWGLSASLAVHADEDRLSCAELAERRAAQQFAEEDAAREDRQAGQVSDGALQRDFLRLDAEAYRMRVYRNCMQLRGAPPPEEPPAPTDD